MFSFLLLALFQFCLLASAKCPSCPTIKEGLGRSLSSGASIDCSGDGVERWSDYKKPNPATVVNVAAEKDVAATVKYSLKYGCKFLAQNGGNGWATTFNLGKAGVLINLRKLNGTKFNSARTEATVQAGVSISEITDAAYENNARVGSGTCNCVGHLGAALGGGVGRTMGIYGLAVDQLLSVNLVTAFGKSIKVGPNSNRLLWWALRGAGPNFGIVTSATVKSYPVKKADNVAWTGSLMFTPDKIEAVVKAIDKFDFKPEVQLDLFFGTSGKPSFTPIIMVLPFYLGGKAAGKKAFKAFYDIGPISETTSELPYNKWNSAGDAMCVKGGRKPSYGISMNKMDPKDWHKIWDEFVEFVKLPGTGASSLLIECYSTAKAKSISRFSSSFPFRHIKFHGIIMPWYEDAKLDDKAIAFGKKVRALARKKDGLSYPASYINFAHGDEPLSQVYGPSLLVLKTLKWIYDPFRRFDQWFSL